MVGGSGHCTLCCPRLSTLSSESLPSFHISGLKALDMCCRMTLSGLGSWALLQKGPLHWPGGLWGHPRDEISLLSSAPDACRGSIV